MPQWRRKLGNVNLIASLLVVEDGSVFDQLCRDQLEGFEPLAPRLDEVMPSGRHWHIEAETDTLHGGKHIGQNSIARLMSLDVVEEEGWVVHVPLVEIDQAAKLEMGIDTIHSG